MYTIRLRLFALVASLIVAASVIGAAPASASVRTEDDFTLTVFPNETTAVNFWDSWGARRSGGRRHAGTDIMAPRGTAIRAVADGTVTEFGKGRLSGYFIRLDHGNGWSTSYMHLNNDTLGTDDGAGGEWTAFHPLLTVGSDVVAGQVIGYVGDSGNAEGTQPHTHFEVRHDGDKVNPYPFLRDAWRREMRTAAPTLMPR